MSKHTILLNESESRRLNPAAFVSQEVCVGNSLSMDDVIIDTGSSGVLFFVGFFFSVCKA